MKRIIVIVAAVLAVLLSACYSARFSYLEEFSVDHRSPSAEIGTLEVQFDKLLGVAGIKKGDITVHYFPKEDAVCLEFRTDFITYKQFWSRRGRQTFISALDNYKADYEQKNLGKNSRANKKKYALIQSFLQWQSFSFSARLNSHPEIGLGYYFREKSPFFSITQQNTMSENTSSGDTQTSPEIMVYFTIAQAEELASMFDPAYLQGFGAVYSEPTPIEPDEY